MGELLELQNVRARVTSQSCSEYAGIALVATTEREREREREREGEREREPAERRSEILLCVSGAD